MSRIDEHFHLRAGKTYNSSAVMAYYLLIHADVAMSYICSCRVLPITRQPKLTIVHCVDGSRPLPGPAVILTSMAVPAESLEIAEPEPQLGPSKGLEQCGPQVPICRPHARTGRASILGRY